MLVHCYDNWLLFVTGGMGNGRMQWSCMYKLIVFDCLLRSGDYNESLVRLHFVC